MIIKQDHLVQSIHSALQYISYYHSPDFISAMVSAYEREANQSAKNAISQILINSKMCALGKRPICQDTGIVNVFVEVGMELKSSPLKTLKNGEIRSKERLVLNIINYLEVHKEEFDHSSFWKKNAHLLLIFYLHDKEKDLLDYLIKLVDDWKYPNQDLSNINRL